MENLLLLLPDKPRSVVTRYGLTALIVTLCALVRIGLDREAGVYGFYLFMPGVFLAALLFDRGSGFLATGLSVLVILLLLPPEGSLAVERRHFIPIVLFGMIAAGLAAASEALRKALERAVQAEREKDLLFRELVHRTKNNLQLAASLLSLQARSSKDPDMRSALDAAGARIRVIGRVHEQLHPNGVEGVVEMQEYVSDLCASLADGLSGARAIALRVEAEPLLLPSHIVVPLGLILNELVTNSLKYAFPDRREGAIDVIVRRKDDAWLELIVADDGVGCDKEAEGAGGRLVALLSKQLGGEVKRQDGKPGCRSTIVVALPAQIAIAPVPAKKAI